MSRYLCFVLLFTSLSLNAFEFMYSAQGVPCRWNSAAGQGAPIVWRVAPDAPPLATLAMVTATQAWSEATGKQLNFQQIDNEEQACILLVWDTECEEPFPAFTSFVALNGNIIYAVITINGKYRWRQLGGGPAAMDLHAVVLHEMGHALGLGHARNQFIVGSFRAEDMPTMNALVTPGAGTLHFDDIFAIQLLYEIQAPFPEFSVTAWSPLGKAPFPARFEQSRGDAQTYWNFGDGAEALGAAPKHRYTAPGVYTVIAESNGLSATTTIEVQSRRRKRTRQFILPAP